MKKVLKINNEGFFLEDVVLKDEDITPNDCIEILCPDGFYKPKWTGSEWVEGLTVNEINIIENAPTPKTEFEILSYNQSLIQKALDDLIFGGVL